jgi:hypothetical protein
MGLRDLTVERAKWKQKKQLPELKDCSAVESFFGDSLSWETQNE